MALKRDKACFPHDAFATLASAEPKHWWFKARNKIILWALSEKVFEIKNLLEVGCGTGFVIQGIAREYPFLNLEASEYLEEGLKFARQRVPTCSFRQLDATLMVDTDAYDCIGAFDVIEHIESDELVLSNFYQALRRGGFLMLTVPQHPWLWSAADEYAHHVRRYSRSELLRKVQNSGFFVEYCTSFVSLLLPIMALQRYCARNKRYDPNSEFNLSPLLNTFLYSVMQLERTLLKLGLRFPMGGSLMLLASKP